MNRDKRIIPDLQDADLSYFPKYFPPIVADRYYEFLLEDLDWRQYDIKIFGKKIPQPRLTALYAEGKNSYTYSNLTLFPNSFTPELAEIKSEIENTTGFSFTHCLANLYREGNDSMGWHADDERELGQEPVIASLSFGAVRKFQMKHKLNSNIKYEVNLEHGSLLLMKGKTQEYWKHQIPKTKTEVSPRINLTFRRIL